MKLFIAIISISIFLLSCESKQVKKENPQVNQNHKDIVELTPQQFKNAGIELGKLEKRSLLYTIKLNGQIDVPPQNMASISMPLGGYLKSTQLLPGMQIRKGEVIARMEDQQYIQLQQDYLVTKTKLLMAEKEYIRQKELNQDKATSDKIYQQTETEYRTLRINLNSLVQKLKFININPATLTEKNITPTISIYSPISGFVSKVNVNIGKYVAPTDVLFELVNPEDIHLNLKVFEKDLDKVAVGQNLVAYSNNRPDKKFHCKIVLISKDLSAEHTADIHCHFTDYDKELFPGLYMNAELAVKISNVYSLPEEAIVNYEGKDYIFITLKNNQFSLLPVQTGDKDQGYIEIKNPDNLSGKTIVTKGAYTILMKMKNKSED